VTTVDDVTVGCVALVETFLLVVMVTLDTGM